MSKNKIALLLSMINAAGGTIDASDDPHSLLNYFCDDNGRGADTFNQAIALGYLHVAHDQLSETSTAGLTELGRFYALKTTPAALWREKGEADPHGDRYNCARSQLAGGTLTDDEVANAAYLRPTLPNLEIAKDRIRWLSRQLVHMTAKVEESEQSFDIRWRADRRAISRWQKANPGNDLVWPDHADLCVWLQQQLADGQIKTLSVPDRELLRKVVELAYREATPDGPLPNVGQADELICHAHAHLAMPDSRGALSAAVGDLRAFHEACDIPIRAEPSFPNQDRITLRADLLDEEHEELREAIEERDIVKVADGLADIAYIVLGTALEFGIPLDRVWAEVHRTNMAKVDPTTGKVRRRADGKVLKPEGWTPPDIAKVLGRQETEHA